LDDASDADLDKHERAIDRAMVRLEKLNASEPLLRERLVDAQAAARKRRWDALHEAHHAAAVEFLSAAQVTVKKHNAMIAIVDQAQRENFSGLVASTMPRTPNIEGNPVLAADLLEAFERALQAPAPRRSAKAKPAKVNPEIWNPNSPDYGHPASQQLRTMLKPPAAAGSMQHAIDTDSTLVIVPLKNSGKTHADAIADDTVPLGPNEVRVIVLRRGFTGGLDGGQCQTGRRVRMLKGDAKIAADNGAIEILNEAPIAASTNTVGDAGEGAAK
jgi:hypothetical protein